MQTVGCHYSALKRTELSTREKTWGTLKCTRLSGEASLKRPRTACFQLGDIPEKAKLGTVTS